RPRRGAARARRPHSPRVRGARQRRGAGQVLMNLACTIDVALDCAGWTRLCPRAESLARSAAELALAHGTIALGLTWRGTVELGITLGDAAHQRQLNREY